jgi:hypothetical protein
MILVAARHAAPAIYTPWDKQTRLSKWIKGKTTKMSRIRIQTSPSQWHIIIKPSNWPLGFSITPRVVAEKATKMFCENMKVLLFEDEEYKGSIFGNYNIGKNLGAFM